MDFTVRASNREAYIAPDRGAQGNALMTLLSMPVVVDRGHGKLIVAAHGKRHEITAAADPITQRAVVRDDVSEQPTAGTTIRIQWAPRNDCDGAVLWPFDNLEPIADWNSFPERFRAMIEGFALFNPHATFKLDWFGKSSTWKATDTAWEKWKPCRPTSPHWY
jgi:hypothetical protein